MALSQAIHQTDGDYWIVPNHYHKPIRQDAVILKSSKMSHRFIEFIKSEEIRSLIASYVIRTPVYIIYSIVTALLTTLFTVVPVLYFKNQEVITWKVPYKELRKNFKRYLLAGFLYSICLVIGYLFCVVPGIAISFIGPAYVNKIVCSDLPIVKAFSSSFQAVFKSPNLWSYIGMTILAGLLYFILTVCSCGIGSIITFPLLSIYSIHLAYNKGIIN